MIHQCLLSTTLASGAWLFQPPEPASGRLLIAIYHFFFFTWAHLGHTPGVLPLLPSAILSQKALLGPALQRQPFSVALHRLSHQQISGSIVPTHLRPNILEPQREMFRAPFLSSSQGCLLAQFQGHHPSCTQGIWFPSEHIFKEYRHPSQQIALWVVPPKVVQLGTNSSTQTQPQLSIQGEWERTDYLKTKFPFFLGSEFPVMKLYD